MATKCTVAEAGQRKIYNLIAVKAECIEINIAVAHVVHRKNSVCLSGTRASIAISN